MIHSLKNILISFLFLAFYVFFYLSSFSLCLKDDVVFRYGKKLLDSKKKSSKNFIHTVLFLYIKDEVVLWHYIIFWINLISFAFALIIMNLYIIWQNKTSYILFIIFFSIFFISALIISCVYWPYYSKYRMKYRKNYRHKYRQKLRKK